VVLVGGGTRMPMVKNLVRSLIDREPSEHVNPDEAVAIGAAIQAGILTQEVGMRDILLLDVTPISLGLETIGGLTKKLIPRNTTIPVRRSDIFSTSENNQTMVEVHVVQGEREMAADNKSLGRFKLLGIPPAPRGVPQISVSFDIDANGILQVTAVDKTTGREQGITIQGASTLSEAEIQKMIQDAERNAQQDRERRERVEKRTKAEALTYQAERQLREVALDFGMQFASPYRRKIEALIKDLRDALANNDERRIDTLEADLRDALYQLQQEVYQFDRGDEDEGFFSSLKRTLLGDDDEFDEIPSYRSSRDPWDDRPATRRDPWDDRPPARRDSWSDRPDPYSSRPAARDSYARDSYGSRPAARDSWDEPRDLYGSRPAARDSWTDRGGDRPDPYSSRPARPAGRDSWDEPQRPSRPAARDSWNNAPSRSRDPLESRPSRSNGDRWEEPPSRNRDLGSREMGRESRREMGDLPGESFGGRRPENRGSEGRSAETRGLESRSAEPRNRPEREGLNLRTPDLGRASADSRDPATRDPWDDTPSRPRRAPTGDWDDAPAKEPTDELADKPGSDRPIDPPVDDAPRRRPPTDEIPRSRSMWDEEEDEWL
ncbi:MAG: Hsp70 family protein, partial [Cyanobacteriota bacterium]